jgi:hypothetical protein
MIFGSDWPMELVHKMIAREGTDGLMVGRPVQIGSIAPGLVSARLRMAPGLTGREENA